MNNLTAEDRIRIKDVLEATGTIQSCGNCYYWDLNQETCNKFKTLPPPRVILNGCEKWEIFIPF